MDAVAYITWCVHADINFGNSELCIIDALALTVNWDGSPEVTMNDVSYPVFAKLRGFYDDIISGVLYFSSSTFASPRTRSSHYYQNKDVRRNVIRSSLEDANRIYPNLTNDITAQGFASAAQPYPFLVPSTVRSTLGSPVGQFELH